MKRLWLFLESTDFENAIGLVVLLGGDADTMGAITGEIAETLPNEFIDVMQKFYQKFVDK